MGEGETLEETVKRARKLWYLVWIGIIWSFLFTATALFMMNDLTNRFEDSCEIRQQGRTAVRTLIQKIPDLTHEDLIYLDEMLPPTIQSC